MHMKATFLSVLLLLLLLTVLSFPPAAGGAREFYAEERYDLILLRESLLSTLNLHSNWTGPPCYFNTSKWIGITCSDDSHVVGVALEDAHLTGLLPSTAFRNMRHLRVLNLRNNALRGPLPTLDGLVDLRYVSLSHNRFSGFIPAGFRRLPNLTWLEVQDNLLDGVIPALEQDLQVFNVSYNFLRGSVPSKLQRFPQSSFDHNSELCGKPLSTPCSSTSPHLIPTGDQPVPSASNDPSSEKSRNKALGAWSGIVLIFVAATMVSLVVVTMMFLVLGRNKGNSTRKRAQAQPGFKEGKNEEIEFLANKRWVPFGIQQLLRSPAELLGRGKVGNTFRATLDTTGSIVRVKRLNQRLCDLPKKEFAKQMHLLGRMKHENLVEVISFYYSMDEKLVISECVPGGSVFDHLHGSRGEGRVPLNWTTRLRIVKGVANGLDYMHHHQPYPSSKTKTAPHGNLKSTNIMILQSNQPTGHHFQAKLTDFGFLPLLSSRGMAGKLAVGKTPEFSQGQKLACKADVFCLGLVLLEVVTGHYSGDRHDDLVVWVRSAVRAGRARDVVDVEMVRERDALGEMAKLAEIALECLAPRPEKRPEMSELVKRIGEIRETTHESFSGRRSFEV